MYVRSNLSLQLRIMRLANVFQDFHTTEARATVAFRRYRQLNEILQRRLNVTVKPWMYKAAGLVEIGPRENMSEEAGTDEVVIHRKSWTRVINGNRYSFWRRTYADGDVQLLVWSDVSVLVHDLWGRTAEANNFA